MKPAIFILTLSCLLGGCIQASKVDQQDFESLYRSAKSLSGATEVGVNYRKMSELIQSLAGEVSIGKDKADSETEKSMVALYAQALDTYKDSTTIWDLKINGKEPSLMPSDEIYLDDKLIPIVERYSIPTIEREGSYLAVLPGETGVYRYKTIPEESIQLIWSKAEEYLKDAEKLYNSK